MWKFGKLKFKKKKEKINDSLNAPVDNGKDLSVEKDGEFIILQSLVIIL